ncbi:MAG: hypothetical protein HN567_01110 [Actinobacteria bacterium]|nr:hypothetical protein [Actinomycetota bacterium]MBT3746335.1 hypothetical protein [Actinomycetota bacterium]MBT3970409.1 hypothetical protein [Actinomycetota bacterium]MBT4009844.1 hypothetical protein [Actinomycetota bacterium]MBT4303833.1 hypothetical protein [Actinomycetota bacterium]
MNEQLYFSSLPSSRWGRIDKRTRAIGLAGVARARAELHRHPHPEADRFPLKQSEEPKAS